MSDDTPTALIADDEPLLRTGLRRALATHWPGLSIVAEARNGREAVEAFVRHRPDVCFLDVQMPGQSGLEAARAIRARADGATTHLVFVTAFDHYAVDAFEHGVLDYLVKPVADDRLARCVARLQARLRERAPSAVTDELLAALAERLVPAREPEPLDWIRARTGNTTRLVAVPDIDYLRSERKYTKIAWREPDGAPREALVRVPLKDLTARLPADGFIQVHRSTVVNLRAIAQVRRGDNETAEIHLRGRDETLPVSRTYLHHFDGL